ncbi:DUF2993 domain-containing protein [Corynebacterium sp.]|uniref:LmeA family phospholipid-binding protein n=1 Tax=Corynebacterium sp. TaxID=1720 RepID=UPI0026172530|nr:DUF2993 domain-containing protein [Corynebacterium sp.]
MSSQNYYPQQQPQFSGYPAQQEPEKKSKAPKILAIIVVIVLLLALIAEFGARWYIKHEITNAMTEASDSRMTEDPKVSLGTTPVLFGLVQGSLPHLEVEVPSSIDVSYEDNDPSRPVITGMPRTHITGKKLSMGENPEDMIFGELTVDAELPKEVMQAEMIANQNQQSGDDLMSQLLQVNDVVPNPKDQTLEVQFSGGLASIVMSPKIEQGQLTMDVSAVKVFGQKLPDVLAETLGGAVEDSVDQNTPGGLEARDVRITNDGLQISLHGTDVHIDELQNSLNEAGQPQQGGQDSPRGGRGNGDAGDDTPAGEDRPGAVGSGGEIFNRAAASVA